MPDADRNSSMVLRPHVAPREALHRTFDHLWTCLFALG
jgi:hypothetical protein